MWWEWLIVGLLLGVAAMWLLRQAVSAAKRLIEGRGCAAQECSWRVSEDGKGTGRPRELLQVNIESPSRDDPPAPR
jgi:hypothetical protein